MLDFKQSLEQLTEGIREWVNEKSVTNNEKSLMFKQATVSDLNLLVEPGFYFLSSSYEYQNKPFNAGVILVFNDTAQSGYERHYQIGIQYGFKKVYTRTVKVGGVYQPWTLVYDSTATSEDKKEETKVLTDCDINEVTEMGSYVIGSSYKYTNLPAKNLAGLLLVYNNYNQSVPTRLYQIFIAYKTGNYYIRNRINNTEFTEWVNLRTDPAVIEAKADKDEVMLKNEYLQYIAGNMFDGNYIEGFQIANPNQGLPFLNRNPEFNSMAIFNIKPNTTYSIVIENPQLEPMNEFDAETQSFYYFKVYSATHRLEEDEPFDGEIKAMRTRTKTEYFEVTSGPNDTVCYVQTAKKLQPFMQFIEGSYDKYVRSEYGTETYQLADFVKLSKSHIEQVQTQIDSGAVVDAVVSKLNNDIIPPLKEEIVGEATQTAAALDEENKPKLINLFDGNYVEGYTITGSSAGSYKLGKSSIFKSLAVIPVKPNTTYTFFQEFAEKETQNDTTTSTTTYWYGKYATANQIYDLTKIGSTGTPFNADGYVGVQKQLSGGLRFELTTTEDTQCLYIQVGRKIRPSLIVLEGSHKTNPYADYYSAYTMKAADGKNLLTFTEEGMNKFIGAAANNILKNESETLIAPIVEPIVSDISMKNHGYLVTKTVDTLLIKRDRALFTIKKVQNTAKNLDIWRWTTLDIDGENIFTNADCEGVILEKDAGDHIAGYHGNEIIDTFYLQINNQEIAASETFENRFCDNINLFITSRVCSYFDGQELFYRHKRLYWHGDDLDIYNLWTYSRQEPSIIQSVKLSGMMSVACNTIHGYSYNTADAADWDIYTTPYTDPKYRTVRGFTASGFSSELKEVNYFGRNNFLITIRTSDSHTNYGGRVTSYDLDENNLDAGRLKSYFETFKDNGGSGAGYLIEYGDDEIKGHSTITIKQYGDERVGDIDKALDAILAMQKSMIGGEGV